MKVKHPPRPPMTCPGPQDGFLRKALWCCASFAGLLGGVLWSFSLFFPLIALPLWFLLSILHLNPPEWVMELGVLLYAASFFLQFFLGWLMDRLWKRAEKKNEKIWAAAAAEGQANIIRAMQEPSYWACETPTTPSTERAAL
jgi:hypothetical protein